MNELLINQVKQTVNASIKQITSVLTLLDEGNTIPFIARYRKEVTGGLDEEVINQIHKEWEYANSLFNRKEDVIRLIDEKGLLTEELKNQILKATKLVEVEDLYRPFKEKKKTKATDAIAKGLQPLADFILSLPLTSIKEEAKKYLTEEVKSVDEAITLALYIVAEIISDNAKFRKELRDYLFNHGLIVTTLKKDAIDEKQVYSNYYDYNETINKIKPHRYLAINRAENEKILSVKLEAPKDGMQNYLEKVIITKSSEATSYLKEAITDSLKRLIFPSIEREIRAELKEVAENGAIDVFAENLSKLLLQPPLKGKVILGVDPAFRTGCKLCIINPNGDVLDKSVIYPNEKSKGSTVDPKDLEKSIKELVFLIKKYSVELIAIGNGTASRETESFIASVIKQFNLLVNYVIVNEAGASVYSASEIAREEFPTYSVEERSAASIARRLLDPLAELVKIDPKSIGVGQYQHDLSQKKLNESLDFVVIAAVNSVGVNVNTASKSLLTYVSGLNKGSAQAIVDYRQKNGKFSNRDQLLKVPKLKGKTFEQSVGFLRIPDGSNPLDQTSIHPESYQKALEVMKLLKISQDMIGKPEIQVIIKNANKLDIISKLGIDKYTLDDILDSFASPLRDPRDKFAAPILKSDILSIENLTVGMELEGTVRNVIDFGAFVDIGLKNDGLVHISKIKKGFVKHPKDVLSVGDIVTVYVLGIDIPKGKVSLTMVKE